MFFALPVRNLRFDMFFEDWLRHDCDMYCATICAHEVDMNVDLHGILMHSAHSLPA